MKDRFEFTRETVIWCARLIQVMNHRFGRTSSQEVAAMPIYNVMADGLEWPDEVPEGLLFNGELKQLYSAFLNARTTIILRLDHNGFCKEITQKFADLCPDWPGVLESRFCVEWADTYFELSKAYMQEVQKNL